MFVREQDGDVGVTRWARPPLRPRAEEVGECDVVAREGLLEGLELEVRYHFFR